MIAVAWAVQVYPKRLTVDKFDTDRFAFITYTPELEAKHNIVVYSPTSPQPLKIISVYAGVLALAFVPSLTGGNKVSCAGIWFVCT